MRGDIKNFPQREIWSYKNQLMIKATKGFNSDVENYKLNQLFFEVSDIENTVFDTFFVT